MTYQWLCVGNTGIHLINLLFKEDQRECDEKHILYILFPINHCENIYVAKNMKYDIFLGHSIKYEK